MSNNDPFACPVRVVCGKRINFSAQALFGTEPDARVAWLSARIDFYSLTELYESIDMSMAVSPGVFLRGSLSNIYVAKGAAGDALALRVHLAEDIFLKEVPLAAPDVRLATVMLETDTLVGLQLETNQQIEYAEHVLRPWLWDTVAAISELGIEAPRLEIDKHPPTRPAHDRRTRFRDTVVAMHVAAKTAIDSLTANHETSSPGLSTRAERRSYGDVIKQLEEWAGQFDALAEELKSRANSTGEFRCRIDATLIEFSLSPAAAQLKFEIAALEEDTDAQHEIAHRRGISVVGRWIRGAKAGLWDERVISLTNLVLDTVTAILADETSGPPKFRS